MAESRVTMMGWPARGADILRAAIQVQQALGQTAAALGDELRAVAIDESPTGSGVHAGPRFRDAWVVEVTPRYQGGARVLLGNAADHALFVLEPTRPHDIWANHALQHVVASSGRTERPIAPGNLGFLRFEYRGHIVYKHMVHHRGTKGNPVGQRTNDRMQGRYEQVAADSAGGAISVLSQVFH